MKSTISPFKRRDYKNQSATQRTNIKKIRGFIKDIQEQIVEDATVNTASNEDEKRIMQTTNSPTINSKDFMTLETIDSRKKSHQVDSFKDTNEFMTNDQLMQNYESANVQSVDNRIVGLAEELIN